MSLKPLSGEGQSPVVQQTRGFERREVLLENRGVTIPRLLPAQSKLGLVKRTHILFAMRSPLPHDIRKTRHLWTKAAPSERGSGDRGWLSGARAGVL